MKSIKTKGMVLSFSIILFAVLTLGLSAYYRFKNILIDEVNNAIEKVAQESADHLNNYINQYVTPLIGLSQNETIQTMDWSEQKKILLSQINPMYLNVAVVDINGRAHYIDDSIIDLSDRDYVVKALSGSMTFSDVLISRKTGMPVIMVSVPISKNNAVRGALIARLDVDFLSDYAMLHGYGEHGRAYIISDKGSFITRPAAEKDNLGYNLYDTAKSDTTYAAFAAFIKENETKVSGYGQYEFEGKRILMAYASVNKTNWKIFIGTYEEDTLDNLKGLRTMIISIMAATLILSLMAASIFVARFSKSITELDHLFELGAKGNLTIRFTPKSKDEIGRVGISFNRMMDKIKTLTQYDPLTALLNQYVLEKDLDALVHSEDQKEFSLVMIAINKFSFINESYGYPAGDAILVEVARRISGSNLGCNPVYRYKGDEFVILCREVISESELSVKAQNILNLLKESYQVNDKFIPINISIGIFQRTKATSMEEPLKAVTQAKNYAKYVGSNQIQKFDPGINKLLMTMNELQADIITGLRENQFFLVYQPLFYLENERVAEVEALIRWNHPEKGLLYPDQFIDLAEQAGTIVNLDHWVLESACRQLRNWKVSKKTPIILSVNISAWTFETRNFVSDIIYLVRKYDIDPTLLQLEITERMVIKNIEESISKFKELQEMGIHIAIDDFGIGYSSLSYIVRLPIDSIKIDKAFVQNIDSSKEAKAIVTTIIKLCKTLNLGVIAEGIENSDELEYLKMNSCEIGQGYYYSKPISIEELEDKYLK